MLALQKTATELVATGKGILAADESIATMSKRLEGVGVSGNVQSRRDYRELLLTTPGLDTTIAGIILCDETLRQNLADGTPFPAACSARGIQPGIKVDTGTTPLPFGDGGLITEGLDGLG
ncbi:MAG: fructose-bisphosphate aldolase, partial [Actinobacteria bacterium]|nr:fructose-bisphosphate aldolase [Actinomycetota bacterium]